MTPNIQDPYSFVCQPQQSQEKAKTIVDGLRKNISVVGQIQPAGGLVLDNELKNLLQKYRQANTCPSLDENAMYRDELTALADKIKAQAESAMIRAQEQQQQKLLHQISSERVMILGAVSLGIVILGVIVTIILLKKKA